MTGMLRQERFEDLDQAILAATAGLQSKIWTAMPGIIQTVDLTKMTCTVQVSIFAQLRNPDGTYTWAQIAPLLDCPLVFPNGGGFMLTFPVAAGDEALVVFASRCIDAWWQQGGYKNPQMQLRMHDLSDGFVIPGPRSQPRVIPAISNNSVQLRNEAGDAYVEIDGDGNVNIESPADVTVNAGGDVEITAAASATITAPLLTINGDVQINGALGVDGESEFDGSLITSGQVTAQGIPLSTHHHGGVTTGGGNTSGPAA